MVLLARPVRTGRKIFCVSQPKEISIPRFPANQAMGVLNFDSDIIWSLPAAPMSGLADSIDSALDVQCPIGPPRILHLASHGEYDLAALRDARDNVYEEIEFTASELWTLHGSIDWGKFNSSLVALSAGESGARDSWENHSVAVVLIPATLFNGRALRLLKKLAVLRNWSRLIDYAISEIVRRSKHRRGHASQFLAEIRWHLVHGCHPPDRQPAHVFSNHVWVALRSHLPS